MELHFLLSLVLCSVLFLQQPCMALQLRDSGEEHHLFRRPHDMIVHPPTGYCVLRKRSLADPLKLGSCTKADAWTHTPQNFLVIKGTYFCMQAVGAGKPVRLSILCTPSDSQWTSVSCGSEEEKTHLATKLANGETLCLEVDSDDTLISNPCKSQRGTGVSEFDSQWFAIITTRVGSQNQ